MPSGIRYRRAACVLLWAVARQIHSQSILHAVRRYVVPNGALSSASPGGMLVVWCLQCMCAHLVTPRNDRSAPVCVGISPQAPALVNICHVPTAQSGLFSWQMGLSSASPGRKLVVWCLQCTCAHLVTPRNDRSVPVCVDISPTGPCAGRYLPCAHYSTAQSGLFPMAFRHVPVQVGCCRCVLCNACVLTNKHPRKTAPGLCVVSEACGTRLFVLGV